METEFALLDADGVVINKIVADEEFMKDLSSQLTDPDIESGDLAFTAYVNVTGKDVVIGATQTAKGKFEPPSVTGEVINVADLEAQQVEETASRQQRAEDHARLTALRAKVGPGKSGLTPAERDEVNVIIAMQQLS